MAVERAVGVASVSVLDQGSQALYPTRAEVHADPRLIHRAIHILILRGDGRLLTPAQERELARLKDLGDEAAKRWGVGSCMAQLWAL